MSGLTSGGAGESKVVPPWIAEIEQMRRRRMTGPAIARALGMARSTVGPVLRRPGLGKFTALEPKVAIKRKECSSLGEMVHLGIKKLGRFGN